jgi:hypothetical protein
MFSRCILSRIAAGALCVVASVPVTSQGRPIAIIRVNVVDVADGRIVPDSTVVVRGRTITAIVRGGAPPTDARVIDGLGKFLIPGLWDMHAHIQGSGEPWLQLNAVNGVTGIRDMGADLEFILAMRDATSSGRVLGPEVIAAGPILDDAPGDWPLRMRVKNAVEGRAAVQLLKRRGVDLIKVHNFTPRDAFFAIADEARRQSLPLVGHVPLKVTVEEGIEAGMTNIEHLSEDGKMWKACSGGAEAGGVSAVLRHAGPQAHLADANPGRLVGARRHRHAVVGRQPRASRLRQHTVARVVGRQPELLCEETRDR